MPEEVEFFPATVMTNWFNKFKGLHLNNWEDNVPFKYNKLLVSYFYAVPEGYNFRDKFNIPRKDFTLIIDSGGWQNITAKIPPNLDPIEVLRFQEKNADVGFLLDYPPEVKPLEFEKFLTKSIKAADLMSGHRVNKNMKLYAPIHGKNNYERKIWLDKITENYEYDGYCVGGLTKNEPTMLLEAIDFFKENGEKPIHFLGIAGNIYILLLMASTINYKAPVWFDNTKFTFGRQFGTYLLPIFPPNDINTGFSSTLNLKKLPCNCPICSICEPDDMKKDAQLIVLHNLYVLTSTYKFFDCLKYDKEEFTKYADIITNNRFSNTFHHYKDNKDLFTY